MKLITLNTWGGRAGHENYLKFIESKKGTDIFCLQEVWDININNEKQVKDLTRDKVAGGVSLKNVLNNMMIDLFPKTSSVLEGYSGFFRPHYGSHYGLATFIKKDLDMTEEGDIFVFKDRDFVPTGDIGNHGRNIQFISINTSKGLRTIINFHGLWNGKGKTDTEDRLQQSENIINFLKTLENPFVLCGDFNLLPDTESLNKFEVFGLRNLIKENNVTSTRTSFYKKDGKFADYVFVSKGIEVMDFKVLPDEVSDHSAIYLEFI